jgi:hypothetical protein
MNSRLLRCILLGFTCLWFGMLVPMHQRGQIQLPGSEREQASDAGVGCCQKASKPSCHNGKSSKDGKPAAPNPGNCAVCHFIVGLHAPPPVTFVETRHGLVELIEAGQPSTFVARHAALPYHGLDPPTV